MKFDDLLKTGQLKKERSSQQKLAEFLQVAAAEIAAARFNLEKFPLTAYKSAYDALLHGGNALIRYYGYRPTTKYTHATITECVERILGQEYGTLVRSFKQMRRRRHPLQYEAVFIQSQAEVSKSIKQADTLIKKIKQHIHIKPQRSELF